MSTAIADYNLLDVLYEGAVTCVYRAEKNSASTLESTPVILKTLRAEYPTVEETSRLRHEYQVLQSLEIEEIIKPLVLESHQHKLVLILSDFCGELLANVITDQPFYLESFLKIAIN